MTPEELLKHVGLEQTGHNLQVAKKVIDTEEDFKLRNRLRKAFEILSKLKEYSHAKNSNFNEMLPIIDNRDNPISIILDIGLLPSEYQGENLKQTLDKYNEDFNVKVIPVDYATKSLVAGVEMVKIVR